MSLVSSEIPCVTGAATRYLPIPLRNHLPPAFPRKQNLGCSFFPKIWGSAVAFCAGWESIGLGRWEFAEDLDKRGCFSFVLLLFSFWWCGWILFCNCACRACLGALDLLCRAKGLWGSLLPQLPRHGKPLLRSGLKLAVYFAVLETYFIMHSSAKRLPGFLPLLAPQLLVTADGGCFGLDPACGKWSGGWTEEVGSSQGSRRVGMALPRKMDRLEAGEVRRVFVEI